MSMELVMIVGVVVAMVRIADSENRSMILWGVISLVLCGLCLAIPLPYIRVIIAGIVAFALMTAANIYETHERS